MVVIDNESVVVKKDIAELQLAEEKEQVPGEGAATGNGDKEGGSSGFETGKDKQDTGAKLKKHFYGTVSLKPDKAILGFDQIVREVVQHFSSKVDAKVKINIEIDAQSPKGFDESTQRTVKENSRTLGFNQSEFEEE